MVLRKQTIWLLTMLTLMVVLSGYYLVNPPEEVNLADVEGTIESDPAEKSDTDWVETFTDMNKDYEEMTESSGSALDFFINYRIERDNLRYEMLEKYESLMSSSESTAQTVAEAQTNWDELQDFAMAEMQIEQMIKAEGYEEAVLMKDKDGVTVVVRSDDALENEDVVKIIHLVRNHLDIPGHNVRVRYQ